MNKKQFFKDLNIDNNHITFRQKVDDTSCAINNEFELKIKEHYISASVVASLVNFICKLTKENPEVELSISFNGKILTLGQIDRVEKAINKIINDD